MGKIINGFLNSLAQNGFALAFFESSTPRLLHLLFHLCHQLFLLAHILLQTDLLIAAAGEIGQRRGPVLFCSKSDLVRKVF
jgi:hypothetical protein